MVGTIALPGAGVASHLASNGRRRSFQCTSDGPHTEAALSHRGNGNSVLRLKLLVSGRFLHVHTLQEKVLHFIFEAAQVHRAGRVARARCKQYCVAEARPLNCPHVYQGGVKEPVDDRNRRV
jgi:hypothetical protein